MEGSTVAGIKFCDLYEWGPGTGKTTRLVDEAEGKAIELGSSLERNGKEIIVISHTNSVVDRIRARTKSFSNVKTMTLHKFAWKVVRTFKNRAIEIIKARYSNHDHYTDLSYSEENFPYLSSCLALVQKYKDRHSYNEDEPEHTVNTLRLKHDWVIGLFNELLKQTDVQDHIVSKYPIIFIDEVQDIRKSMLIALLTAFSIVINKNRELYFAHLYLFGDRCQDINIRDLDSQNNSEDYLPWDFNSKDDNKDVIPAILQQFKNLINIVPTQVVNSRSHFRLVDCFNHLFTQNNTFICNEQKARASNSHSLIECNRIVFPHEWRFEEDGELYLRPQAISAIQESFSIIKESLLKNLGNNAGTLKVITGHVKDLGLLGGFYNLVNTVSHRNKVFYSFLEQVVLPLIKSAQTNDIGAFNLKLNHLLKTYSYKNIVASIERSRDQTGLPVAILSSNRLKLDLSKQNAHFKVLFNLLQQPELTSLSDVLSILFNYFHFPVNALEIKHLDFDEALNLIANKQGQFFNKLGNARCLVSEVERYFEYLSGESEFSTIHKAKGLEFNTVIFVHFDIRMLYVKEDVRHESEYRSRDFLKSVSLFGLRDPKNLKGSGKKTGVFMRWKDSCCYLYTGFTRAKTNLCYVYITEALQDVFAWKKVLGLLHVNGDTTTHDYHYSVNADLQCEKNYPRRRSKKRPVLNAVCID